jgi:hypothetical protein
MNRDDIIRMAREAGFELAMWQMSFGCEAKGTHEELTLFAKLVAAAERERDTALFRQLLALCNKEGGWTLEEAADTICDIDDIVRARLEGYHLRGVTKMIKDEQ